MRKNAPFIVLPLLFIVLSGCNDLVQVRGTVKWEDGSPVREGTVVFDDSVVSAVGAIQSDGRFSMGMLRSGEGIKPSTYRIIVAGDEKLLRAPSGKSLVARVYSDMSKTPISLTVTEGRNEPLELVIKKNPDLTPQDDIAPPPNEKN